MNDKIENPPAFARTAYAGSDEPNTPYPHHEQEGMSLRDYFAAAALTGFMARDFKGSDMGNNHHNHMLVRPENPKNYTTAEICYGLADAMLEVRAK